MYCRDNVSSEVACCSRSPRHGPRPPLSIIASPRRGAAHTALRAAGPAMAIFSQDPLSLQRPLICYLAQLVATFNSVDTDLIGPRQGTINNMRKL